MTSKGKLVAAFLAALLVGFGGAVLLRAALRTHHDDQDHGSHARDMGTTAHGGHGTHPAPAGGDAHAGHAAGNPEDGGAGETAKARETGLTPASAGAPQEQGLNPVNAVCPGMGGEVPADNPEVLVYNGHVIGFCCKMGCEETLLKDPLGRLKKLAAKGVELPEALLQPAAHPELVYAGNTSCPVTGKPIPEDAEPALAVHNGVVVRLAGPEAERTFAEDPARYLERAAESGKIPADRLPAGPLKPVNAVCPSMGGDVPADNPEVLVYNGHVIGFCCKMGCEESFLKDPLGRLKKLAAKGVELPEALLHPAAHPELVHAGNTSCPVSGKPIPEDAEPALAVHNGVVVRLAGPEAERTFAKDPARYLKRAAESGRVPADRHKER